MTDASPPPPEGGRSIWSKPRSRWLLGIPVGGLLMAVAGIVLANGASFVLHETSSNEFCSTACHYQREFAATELAESVHGSNAAGVRAGCPDCHVPKPFVPLMIRKIEATTELWGHLTGVIATREKYEAHRLAMAEKVWDTMKRTDSRECRTCHDFKAMKFDDQERVASRRHQKAMEKGQTCIDCHKGVAHKLPQGYEDPGPPPDEDAAPTEQAAAPAAS
jgi:nitrate/TMAO reductase-like tetraheme cytochrome c subunit